MRSLTGTETTVLAAANQWVASTVEVQNGDGTFIDLGNLSGANFVDGWSFSDDTDQPIQAATIRVRRDSGNLSLAPFMTGSTLNVLDDGTTYSPLLDGGRRIRIKAANTAFGTPAQPSDMRIIFDGYTDLVEWGHEEAVIECRDLGALLFDTQIDTLRTYGSESGVAIEDVMQEILDDNMGSSVVDLFTPSSPGFLISPAYEQQRESVWDALRALAQLIGYDLRYRWDDGTNAFRLTFFEPDRDTTTSLWTFGPSDYLDVTHLDVDRTDIRNRVRVTYIDSATGQEAFQEASDAASIAKYGDRLLHFIEGTDSSIDTASEALALATAVLSDVSDPIAEQEIQTLFWWPGQLGDLYTFTANDVHYDVDQEWAVTSIRHELAMDRHSTFIRVRGKPAGGFLTWLERGQQFPGDDADIIPEVFSVQALFSTDALTEVQVGVDDDVRADGVNPSGYITIGVNAEPADPTDIANDGTYIVSPGTRTGAVQTNVEVDSDDVAYVKAVALGDDGAPGPVAGPFKFVSPGFQPWTKIYTGVTNAVVVPLLTRDGLPIDSTTIPQGIRIDVDALNLTSGERNTIWYANITGTLSIGVIKEVVPGPNTPEFFLPASIRIEAGGATSDVQVRIHPTREADPPRTRISVGETRYIAPVLATSGNFLDAGGAVLNVRHPDFGALGDGLTDDTAAIQAIINRALISGGVIQFPPGHYLVSRLYFYHDAINNPGAPAGRNVEGKIIVRGSGMGQRNDRANNEIVGTVLEFTETSGNMLNLGNGTAPVRAIEVSDMQIWGNPALGAHLIHMDNVPQWSLIRRLVISSQGEGVGLYTNELYVSTIEDIDIWGDNTQPDSSKDGVGWLYAGGGGGMNTFRNITASHYRVGAQLGEDETSNAQDNIYIGLQVRQCSDGCIVRGHTHGTLKNVWTEGNTQADFRFTHAARGWSFYNGHFGIMQEVAPDVPEGHIVLGSPTGTDAEREYGEILVHNATMTFIPTNFAAIRAHAVPIMGPFWARGGFWHANGGVGVQIDQAEYLGSRVEDVTFDNFTADSRRVCYDTGTGFAPAWHFLNRSLVEVHNAIDGLDMTADVSVPRVIIVSTLAGSQVVNLPDSAVQDNCHIRIIKANEANTVTVNAGFRQILDGGELSQAIVLTEQHALLDLEFSHAAGGVWINVPSTLRTLSRQLRFHDAGISAPLVLDDQNEQPTYLRFDTNGVLRWQGGKNGDSEIGLNAGSNFQLHRYDDTGALLGSPVTVERGTGDITVESDLEIDDDQKGIIMTDRTLGTRHRIYLDNGVLSIEAA